MKKKWYQTVDFFKLTGMVFLWVSAWLFMIPHQVDVQSPFFDNVWGAFLAVFGASKPESNNAQQLPDLMSGLAALFLMIVLQLRGIFSVQVSTEKDKKQSKNALVVFLNMVSVLVHTLFFTMLVKIFLFPATGASVGIYEAMKLNVGITIFTACMVTGMVFGVPSISKLFMVLLFAVGVFKNISLISSIMGVTGFVAAVFAVLGFYLEFLAGGIDKNKIIADLSVLSGHYESLSANALTEGEKVRAAAGQIGSAVVGGALLGAGVHAVSAPGTPLSAPTTPLSAPNTPVEEKKSFLKHAEIINSKEESEKESEEEK